MKLFKRVAVCIILLASLNVAGFTQTVFQLVETVPAETIMEQSKLPRATDVWMEMIKSAKKTIDMETFYIANEKGEPLENVISEIKSAAARGVVVRIMIDGKFFERYKESANDFENIPNITVKKIPFNKIGGGVMHAKYFVVDNKSDLMKPDIYKLLSDEFLKRNIKLTLLNRYKSLDGGNDEDLNNN